VLQAVGQARRFLRTTLAQWGAEQYDFGAPLVLTELATNAALHARTAFEVRLRLEDTHLVVEVADGNPRRPQQRGYDADATTGRGITLVDSLCAGWGVTMLDDTGKVVWARVPPDESTGLAIGPDDVLDLDEASASSAGPVNGHQATQYGGGRAHEPHAPRAAWVRAAA
jgi:hypothetical protein